MFERSSKKSWRKLLENENTMKDSYGRQKIKMWAILSKK